jgi:uncharacterized protein
VDAVRGFALFGVLLVNMYNFGAYSPEWTALADQVSFNVMHGVFETKSWRMFSMLFAFGFALQLMKAESSTGFIRIYVRRLIILFTIGMLHALFYDGDILMEYAMLGFILILFRNVPVGALIILAVILVAVFPVGNLLVSLNDTDQFSGDEQRISLAERREGHPYLGSVGDVMQANAGAIPPRIWSGLHNPESSLAIFAMFLTGFSIGRSRIMHELDEHMPLVRRVFGLGVGVGVSAAVLEQFLSAYFGYAVFRDHTASLPVQFLGDLLFSFGSTALALGYASGIIILVQTGRMTILTGWLQNLGRMALTVYLSGTLMFTLLFYGYGFGQIFLLGPFTVSLYALAFFAIQIGFSSWWLGRFRFGPAEWLWRSLTYGERQALRIGR